MAGLPEGTQWAPDLYNLDLEKSDNWSGIKLLDRSDSKCERSPVGMMCWGDSQAESVAGCASGHCKQEPVNVSRTAFSRIGS